MEAGIILLDTSVLIEFFRSKDKQNTRFYQMSLSNRRFAVSTISKFEIFAGQKSSQSDFWERFYSAVETIPFDDACARTAGEVAKLLRSENKMIEVPDILIAATAITHSMRVATLNMKHFNRIEGVEFA